jgi:D-glycero-alpha-D-manno-heptose-7-phosphate kinase
MAADGIGAAMKRREDDRFLKGIGKYTDDINEPNQTYCYFLRSSVAHARIDKLDTSRAASAPGVVAVLTAEDVKEGGGVPCGRQEHLAAACGGVHAWTWSADPAKPPFVRESLAAGKALDQLNDCLLVAYLGVSHVSKDVNGTWMRQFTSGANREDWKEIILLSRDFAAAIQNLDLPAAVDAMNRETAIRKAMTPNVLDDLGDELAAAAIAGGCGARFTGAGGGGCLWAIGRPDDVASLKPKWKKLLARRPNAGILDCRIDRCGVL